jgi:hypothetical protein
MDKEQSYSELLESILNEELQEEELEELEKLVIANDIENIDTSMLKDEEWLKFVKSGKKDKFYQAFNDLMGPIEPGDDLRERLRKAMADSYWNYLQETYL